MPDRYGNPPDDQPADPEDHECNDGWLGEHPVDGHPIPCLICRPHLKPERIKAQVHGPHWQEVDS